MKIAHVSDIHFGAEVPAIVEGLHQRLDALAPDLVVASGDFTMAARHSEWRDARAFLERIKAPVLAVPGNHDCPVYNLIERFVHPFARYERAIGEITVDRFATDSVALFGVNSARPWDLSFNWSHGRLSNKQARAADRFFSAHADASFKALVVHHPFYVPEDMPGFRTIRNADPMLDVLAQHGVGLVLAGHLHRQFTATRRMTLPNTDHDITLLQVASVTSHRVRDQPNAFVVLDVSADGVEITPEQWDGECFTPSGVVQHLEHGN